jgi:hypothetical protein
MQTAGFAVASQQEVIRSATGDSSARQRLVRIRAGNQQIVAGVESRLLRVARIKYGLSTTRSLWGND